MMPHVARPRALALSHRLVRGALLVVLAVLSPALRLVRVEAQSTQPPAVTTPAAAVIEGGRRVADYRLGARFSTYRAVLGSPTSTSPSRNADDAAGYFYRRYGLLFFVKKDVVNGITVSNPLMQTAEGVRVGTPRAQVLRVYGSPQLLGAGQDRLVYPERGLGFDFKAGAVANVYIFDKEGRDLASGDRRIVAGQRVGGLELGRSTALLTRQWQQPDSQSDLPSTPGARLWSFKAHGVVVVVLDGHIDGVWLFNREFRTSEDLGVGSTRAEVRKVYGRPEAVEKDLEMYASRGIGFLYEGERVVEVMILKPGR